MLLLIALIAVFFALNMGGSGAAAAFAAPYGARLLSHRRAGLLFILFVAAGSLAFGDHVAFTLGQRLVPEDLLGPRALLVIFATATLSILIANLMHIPQSTSLVTVAAIAGVGGRAGVLSTETLLFMVPFWILLPLAAFGLTYGLARGIYPPRRGNFWIYEKLVNHQGRLRAFVIVCSCYNAFSIGTNNVANVAGPLIGASQWPVRLLLAMFAIWFGLGAFLFPGPMRTTGEKLVPLGLLTASIISLVSGTLIIIASSLGVPQSFVMLQMGALFAVGVVKNGREATLGDPIARNTFLNWTINPLLTLIISYALAGWAGIGN